MLAPLRSHLRELALVLKMLPMLPSGIVDRLTPASHADRLRFTSRGRDIVDEVFVPGGDGPHPGLVLCLGVVPVGMDDPRIRPILEAWARAGFVAVVHWSDAMRDRRLDPGDAEDLARCYDALLGRDDVDTTRSGLLGTCVGGSFTLLAAGHSLIRDRVRFVTAFAPYSSLWTFCRDIETASRDVGGRREPWAVDPITRDVYERTMRALSALGDRDALMDAMSPILHLEEIHAPSILIGHDRDDQVIPVAESRRLAAALTGRPGARFTEYAMFKHADPMGRKLSPPQLVRELSRFYGSLHPLFTVTTRP